MDESIRLGRIFGLQIGANWSLAVVFLLLTYTLSTTFRADVPGQPPAAYWAAAVVAVVLFYCSLLAHELGHALVARRLGVQVEGITLWLFGGVAKLRGEAATAGAEARIAAIGPLVSVAVAALFFVLAYAGDALGIWPLVPEAFAWLAVTNLVLAIFNLIPAFPLDGGRIARAIAWKLTGDRNRATRGAARVGQAFSYLFMLFGVLLVVRGDLINGIWSILIGFILGQSARGAVLQTEFSSRIEGIRVADVMDDEPVAIPEDASVERALDEYFLRYRWPWFPVVDGAQIFRGLIERGAADAVPEVSRASSTVADVFETDASGTLRVPQDAPLESLLGNDALRRLGALMAVDTDGRLRGVITADQVGRALRTALSGPRYPEPRA
jgi:Zn-dependent protease